VVDEQENSANDDRTRDAVENSKGSLDKTNDENAKDSEDHGIFLITWGRNECCNSKVCEQIGDVCEQFGDEGNTKIKTFRKPFANLTMCEARNVLRSLRHDSTQSLKTGNRWGGLWREKCGPLQCWGSTDRVAVA
jgi:hypothetical protein